jgi:hypothetical protein
MVLAKGCAQMVVAVAAMLTALTITLAITLNSESFS